MVQEQSAAWSATVAWHELVGRESVVVRQFLPALDIFQGDNQYAFDPTNGQDFSSAIGLGI